jgi:hypothetical protein
LIRLYIPNFSTSNDLLGFSLAQDLVKISQGLCYEKSVSVNKALPYAEPYSQNFFTEKFFPLTEETYLLHHHKVDLEEANAILVQLGVGKKNT